MLARLSASTGIVAHGELRFSHTLFGSLFPYVVWFALGALLHLELVLAMYFLPLVTEMEVFRAKCAFLFSPATVKCEGEAIGC
jgi:hypothetical protein